MAELKNALRSGDVSVSGSRRFRAFEEHLMPHAEFNEARGWQSAACWFYFCGGLFWMHICHSCANRSIKTILAAQVQLPKAELSSAGLKVSPLDDPFENA